MSPLSAGRMSATAASALAFAIGQRVPGWDLVRPSAMVWKFVDPDPAYGGRYVLVDGAAHSVLTVPELAGQQVGPTVVAFTGGEMCARITLGWVTDSGEIRAVLDAVAAIGALAPAP